MTANASRLAKTFAAAALFATAITGVTAGAASAAPAAPAAPASAAAPAPAAPQGFMNVRMTVVNTTDEALTVGGTKVLPGQSTVVDPNIMDYTVGISGGTSGSYLNLRAANPTIGYPVAKATAIIKGEFQEASKSQSVGQSDRLIALNGYEVTAQRNADTDAKTFTFTIAKTSAATMSVDNTKAAHNTYVHVDGKMHPVRKGTSANLPELQRGVAKTFQVQSGAGQAITVNVSWQGNQAVFSSPGRGSAALASGEQVKFGDVTVKRADTNRVTTAFTLGITR